MSPAKAKQEVRRLLKEGQKYNAIAEHLNKAGFKNKRGGPASTKIVSDLAIAMNLRRRNKARAPAKRNTGSPDKLAAVRVLLEMHGDAEEKIALALRVLD